MNQESFLSLVLKTNKLNVQNLQLISDIHVWIKEIHDALIKTDDDNFVAVQ